MRTVGMASSTSSLVTAMPVKPFRRHEYLVATASNQPTRRGRPVVAPYSPPFSLRLSASRPCSSHGMGPAPTAVVYALTTPTTRWIRMGGMPPPTPPPPDIVVDDVTYG